MSNNSKLVARLNSFDRVLTITDLAELLAVSKITIKRLCAANAVPFFKVGRCVRFHPPAIERWIEAQIRPAIA